mgnify:CR=1 FL=1
MRVRRSRPFVDSTLSTPPAAPLEAWQPLTFGGVAAFAAAPAGRLLAVAALVALLVSAAVWRLAVTVWSPTISMAIARLPAEGAIDNGHLVWPAGQAMSLADGSFVSISVTPPGTSPPKHTADLQFNFRSTSLHASSLLGYIEIPYPPGYVLALNRTELDPLWGAWRPHALATVAGTTFVILLALWAIIATLLTIPLRAYALLLGRQPGLGGCWKLAFAALLPGALIMCAALFGYGLRRLSLGELMLIHGLHLLVNTAYLLISPLRIPEGPPPSPFGEPPSPFSAPTPASDASGNPFASPGIEDADASTETPTEQPVDPSPAIAKPTTARTRACRQADRSPAPPRDDDDDDLAINPS